LRLEPVPASARIARRAVIDIVKSTGRGDLADTASLLVTELVTNSIVHARTPILVTITATPHGVRVAVMDSSPHLPVRRLYGAAATTGRGVAVVEQLAERFGTDAVGGNGKTVWFELGTTSAPEAASDVGEPHLDPPALQQIRLDHLPVALARAWQQHADTLLREHLLASWDGDAVDAEMAARQGGAGEAFNALSEALAPLFVAADPPAHADVVLELRPVDVEGFRDLKVVLDRASAMAATGELLAPTSQPEIRRLRRWICKEVLSQATGGAPVPWLGLGTEDQVASAEPVDWDPSDVLASSAATIAADDANRIVAVSPAALALLGWTADELVGRRIVTVIPERLREAHIAAFTMHLLTERTTILNRTVTVPALHRDGSELLVDLFVRRESAPGGRTVFVARLERSTEADASG
jgi:PAS domain S-box-containing protein